LAATIVSCLIPLLVIVATQSPAYAVRPFITDDARIAPKGHVENETFGGPVMSPHKKPAYDFGSIEALSFTSRFELSAGIVDLQYHRDKLVLQDVLIQPKYLIYESFGAVPSVSASAGVLMPVSGNQQQWDQYAMGQLSWFLFRPDNPEHPYDHWLAIHLNAGGKARYGAGEAEYSMKPYWAAGFEVGTFVKSIRFISELYNGDYFEFEQEFPAFSTGFRYYHTGGKFQVDLVWRGVRVGHENSEHGRQWEHFIEIGFRTLFNFFGT
jgi:hypothetical protein